MCADPRGRACTCVAQSKGKGEEATGDDIALGSEYKKLQQLNDDEFAAENEHDRFMLQGARPGAYVRIILKV
jgi:hypothetical protein